MEAFCELLALRKLVRSSDLEVTLDDEQEQDGSIEDSRSEFDETDFAETVVQLQEFVKEAQFKRRLELPLERKVREFRSTLFFCGYHLKSCFCCCAAKVYPGVCVLWRESNTLLPHIGSDQNTFPLQANEETQIVWGNSASRYGATLQEQVIWLAAMTF
jgi:hypothetical protein